jgi:hypothetical protein
VQTRIGQFLEKPLAKDTALVTAWRPSAEAVLWVLLTAHVLLLEQAALHARIAKDTALVTAWRPSAEVVLPRACELLLSFLQSAFRSDLVRFLLEHLMEHLI